MPKELKNTIYKNAEQLMVSVDCIIFGFDNERLKLLLFRRKVNPFKNSWSLIGSFVKREENVSTAANRVLEENTGLTKVFLEELGCYGNSKRDPAARVISIAHYALIRLDAPEIELAESHEAHWFDVDKIPKLVLDHNDMVEDALEKIRRKARYQPIGFELLPKKFTIPQLKSFYDSIYQKDLDKRNFRKRILAMNILEKLDEKDKSTSRKGAFLYQFDLIKYEKLVKEGFNFVV